MLTEKEISKSWQLLFSNQEFTEEVFDKAEALLEHLRPESPLRHRLYTELEELRHLKR